MVSSKLLCRSQTNGTSNLVLADISGNSDRWEILSSSETLVSVFRLKASYFELLYRQYYSCPTSGSRHCSKRRPRNMNSLPPSLVAIFIMNEGRLHLCIMDRCYYRSQLLMYSQVCQSVHKWRVGYLWCQVPSCSLVPCPFWVGRVSLVPRSFRGAVGYF